FSSLKQLSVDQCSRCIQTNDFTAYETLCEFRVFHLFAECDGPPSLKKLCDITLRGMVGHSAERNWVGAGFIARGEGNGEQLGGDLRILVKHFVEVADAEQQNGVGIAALDFAVLPHQR